MQWKNFQPMILLISLILLFSCKEYENIVIHDIPLKEAKNGIYAGEYNTTLVKAKVKVRVKDKAIEDIEIIKHQCGQGKKAEKIIEHVIQKQSLQVDAISGATYSSKVILKAVEKALRKSL
ncbi:MAG: FMN-binding protein [Candidatus Marinimicrobia bacterium]|nr:FMN-binding protein [Candidatus Neomarinimicrobiota bacterium]